MELELVDAQSRDLVSAASEVLAALGEEPKAKHELFLSTVEIITGVCATVPEARADLAATLAALRAETTARGVELLCSGTHPFADWAAQRVTPNERYERLVRDM